MFGSGREALPMSRSDRETLPNDREWLGGPPGCPGVVGRPSRMFGSGLESLPGGRDALLMSGSG